MPSDDKPPRSERQETDESLRVEREKADQPATEESAINEVEEKADAVILQARARADEVLAASRKKMDRQSAPGAPAAPTPVVTEGQRAREDQAVREERADADETLRVERAESVVRLSSERENTDRDLARERAGADEALATRDEFLGAVSHDLRNMLNAVGGFAHVIAERVTQEHPAPAVLQYTRRIERSIGRMSRLIGDLVDVASIAAGALAVTPEVGDPTDIVTEAVDALRALALAGGVSLEVEIVPPVIAPFDPARILQVLINLLSNAIKFTPAGGRVVVRVERAGQDVRFAIRDTGAGIAADQLETVFEQFMQVTKNDRRGVGLGLYISRCIVEGHGGKIWAESKLGEGSSFCFTLPRSAGEPR